MERKRSRGVKRSENEIRKKEKKRKRQDQHKSQNKMVETNANILRVTINVNRLNTLEKV